METDLWLSAGVLLEKTSYKLYESSTENELMNLRIDALIMKQFYISDSSVHLVF